MAVLESALPDKLDSTPCPAFIKALSDPLRMRIMQCLPAGPMTVSDIAAVLEIDLANAFPRLRVMRSARLLASERSGKHNYYSLLPEILQKHRGNKSNALDFGCCRIELTGDP